MVFRAGFLLLLLLLLLLLVCSGTVTVSRADDSDYGVSAFATVARFDVDSLRARGVSACNGQVGDCIDDEEELMLDSVAARRFMEERQKYISYKAMRANIVPCRRRGNSYYNCNQRRRMNPYNRGCLAITRCKRYTW
ncbi:rapid alkalinization factor-like [Diospyros lotus]|uniref:rapid alkalinization factor-like n=1 Tax=Diospyros lotus TaxID=55363 RepID=UPI002257C464|nr:rapid alkalinization factor-like [Diospyros lotus]